MDNNPQHRPSGYVDSLRMSAREHAEILNELDARQARHADANRRTDERLRFSQQALLFVQLRHPGGTDGNYLVRTRNLSRTGIGFFHGAFVYNNTPCTVALRSTDRAIVTIPGRVVRCNHVRGHIHEVGVHFDKPIRLRQFLGHEAPPDADDPTSTALPRLDGRILCVDDSVPDQDLLKFHLEHLGLRCDIAPSPDAALDLAESGARFDLVITALALPGMSALDLAASLRAAGQRCPVIAMTADERDTARLDSLQRGFANFLVKPYRFEDLLRILLNHLTPASSGAGELLPSDLWPDVAMRPLIRRFLQRLGPQAQEIRRLASASPNAAAAIAAGNPDPVFRKLCLELKGSAGSYGYPSISQAAHDLLDPASPYDLPGRLDSLVRLCSAAARILEVEAAATPATPATPAAPAA